MFYYETPWFNQDSESGNCFFFFYMYSVNAVRILDTKGQVLSNEE